MVSASPLPRLVALLAAVTILAGAGSLGSRAALLPTLYVNYTLGCTFTITNDAGATVTSIAPGDYQLLIITPGPFGASVLAGNTDFTACRGFVQFELAGPGTNLSTTLDYGDLDHELDQVTFAPSSTYVAQDLNQPSVAHWTLTTTASGTPTAPTSPATTTSPGPPRPAVPKTTASAKPGRLLGTLAASVTTAGKVTLTYQGHAIDSLSAGRYTITVSDHSKQSGFILRQIRRAAVTVTTGLFVGTRSVTLTLAPGEWFFYSTSAGKESNFIVVA
jgi:hypothetical protein